MASTLQREIQQTRPFRSVGEQVVVNLMRTTDLLTGPWAQHLKRHEGLSQSQYNILRILRGAHPGGHRISDIAERMITRDPDVTRLVDRLVERGLARRKRDTADRRVVLVEITAAGIALLERLDPVLTQLTRACLAGLSSARLRELDALLNELRAGIRTVTP